MALRYEGRPAVEPLLRLRSVEQRVAALLQHLEEGGRDVNELVSVALSALDQQHAMGLILGQPRREHTARRAAARHDEIESLHFLPQSAEQGLNGRELFQAFDPEFRAESRLFDTAERRVWLDCPVLVDPGRAAFK